MCTVSIVSVYFGVPMSATAASSEGTMTTLSSSRGASVVEMTTFRRLGSGLHLTSDDSHVNRPMTTALRLAGSFVRDVIVRKCFKSPGIFHGRPPCSPMPRRGAGAVAATTAVHSSFFMCGGEDDEMARTRP